LIPLHLLLGECQGLIQTHGRARNPRLSSRWSLASDVFCAGYDAVTRRDITSLIGAIYMHIVLIAKQSVRLPVNILLNPPCYYSQSKPPTLFLHLQILIAKNEFPGMLSTFVVWVVVV
jgi:hypothetical protein